MIYLIIAHLFALSFLSYHKDKWQSNAPLIHAWQWFVCVFFAQALFTVFRVSCDTAKGLTFLETWSNGLIWFFLAMSLYQLPKLLRQAQKESPETHAHPVMEQIKKHKDFKSW